VGEPSKENDDLSSRAEALFFAHPEWTAEDWRQRLGAGEIEGVPLPPGVIEELERLIAGLTHFAEVAADQKPVTTQAQEQPSQQPLEVVSRGGVSYQLLDRLGTGGHGIV